VYFYDVVDIETRLGKTFWYPCDIPGHTCRHNLLISNKYANHSATNDYIYNEEKYVPV